jgi:hypothetical protein
LLIDIIPWIIRHYINLDFRAFCVLEALTCLYRVIMQLVSVVASTVFG